MAKRMALKELTDSLRARGGATALEYQTAKFPLQAGGDDYEWRDYVRGKDLGRLLRGQTELLDDHTKPQGPGRTLDDQVADLMARLVQAKLLLPAARRFKKPKPGKKKVVKWPRTLEAVPGAEWSEELFYVFTYDKPTGALFYVGAALVVLAVLGATLFPLAPYRFKVVVLYALTSLLFGMLGLILVRYVVWGAVWLVSGSHFWLLPNLMSESVPVQDLFKPLLQFDRHDPADKLSALPVRAAAAALLGGAAWALLVLGPEASTVKEGVRGAQDSVLKYFDMVDAMKTGITNGTSAPGGAANATGGAPPTAASDGDDGDSGGGDVAGSTGGAAAAGDADAEESDAEEWVDAAEEVQASSAGGE